MDSDSSTERPDTPGDPRKTGPGGPTSPEIAQPGGNQIAAYRPPGKATKRPSPPADPGITPEGEAGVGGPSSAGMKKAVKSRPPLPPKTMKCTICGRVCVGLKCFNKHQKEVHMRA